MAYKYCLNEPTLDGNEIKYVTDVLQKGWLSAGGEYTKRFEQAFASLIGVKHGLAVQSGTAALHTAMLAMGIKPGDKVVVPNYTCGACVTSVLQAGAEPVVIDVEPNTFGMDVRILEEVLKSQTIKAVMVVHVYGFPVRDFDKIVELCKQYHALLLEDASEAHGATYQGRNIGTFGDMAVFSVRSEKMIGVGEGGLVLTDHTEFYDRARFFASRAAPHRSEKDPWWHKYIYTDVGMNYLLPHLLGAVGLAQVEKFPEILKRKRTVGYLYKELFSSVPGIRLQEIAPSSEPCFWLNCILLERSEEEVRRMGTELMMRGIEIRPAFWPLGDLPAFKRYASGSQEQAKELFRRMMVLPSSAKLTAEGVKEIVKEVRLLMEN
ncbi:aminotransferase class I/II-fold pyridoxal phosphate-dependent enzyme [Candidatus Woesearchaeota archaeon]|nr:aminotransferase class I/II-fold pyridoxal phosphate-dependent enzyme [Candidatus Woesearchaeota archaeon]